MAPQTVPYEAEVFVRIYRLGDCYYQWYQRTEARLNSDRGAQRTHGQWQEGSQWSFGDDRGGRPSR